MSKEVKISEILEALEKGENIILHGPGGTGKTFTLQQLARILRENGKKVECTALTGVSAINLNNSECKIKASTLHHFAGIGLGTADVEALYTKILSSPAKKKWRQTEILIIDEISMMGAKLFLKLNYLAKRVRENPNPFGGLQLILSGDFLQLPPVKEEWVFTTKEWAELHLKPFIFEVPKRYDDMIYFNILLRIRTGKISKRDMERLSMRKHIYNDMLKQEKNTSDKEVTIKPTILYSKKVNVEIYNQKELTNIKREKVLFIAQDTFIALKPEMEKQKEKYIQMLEDSIPKTIELKVGAQVMLKYNLSVGEGLINGSRGVVVEINEEDKSVHVLFVGNKVRKIERHMWEIDGDYVIVSRCQIPLILAWSLTIHKSQGCTLDYAVCDIGPTIFSEGQAYVSLSRVRNLKGLFISDFSVRSIRANKEALEYVRTLE